MLENNSTRNVLRFIQIQPPKAVGPREPVTLSEGASFAGRLARAMPDDRTKYGNKHVSDDPR